MTEQKEKLSSLLDDYQADDDRVLDELLGDVNQRYTLGRYQLIGDTIRNELPQRIKTGFAAEVMAQVEQEETYSLHARPTEKTRSHDPVEQTSGFWDWLFKPVAGVAVAAAVAVVTIGTLQNQSADPSDQAQLASNGSVESQAKVERLAQIPVLSNSAQLVSTDKPALQPSPGMNWKIKRDKPEMQSRLNVYLINHNEYSNSINGIIPQARVVGFDDQQ